MAKFCIGCIHLYLRPHVPGSMGSEETGIWGEENAALLCQKGHWEKELSTYANPIPVVDLESQMLRATVCADYTERVIPHG